MTVLPESAKPLTEPSLPPTGGVSAVSRSARRSSVWGVAVLLGAFLLSAMLLVRDAWHRTVVHEAYLPELEAEAKRSPFDPMVQFALGGRLSQAGEYAGAKEHFQQAVAAGENNADLWQMWAAATAASGSRPEAIAVLELGKRSVRDRADADRLQAAHDRAAAVPAADPPGAFAQAVCPETIDQILDRRVSGSFLNGLRSWMDRSHPERSGYATRRAWAAERPDDAMALRWWGLALLRNRRPQAAMPVLEKAANLAPQDADTLMAYADALRQAGGSAKAGRVYQAVLRQRRDYLPALLGLGQVALDKSLIALSVSVFQKATTLAPQSADAWIGLGRAYYSTHIQLGQSVSAFQKAVELAPSRTDFYPDYFRALRLTFKYADAEAIIRKRLQDAPDEGQSYFLLALLLRDYQPTSAREAEEEQALRTALKLAPRSEAAEVALAQLLLKQRKFDEAISLLNDALVQDEFDVRAMQMLERAYRQAGATAIADRFHQEAKEHIRTAKRLGELQDAEHRNPGDVTVHQQLSDLYGQLGRRAEADQERQFTDYLKAHPADARRGISALDAATSISHPVDRP